MENEKQERKKIDWKNYADTYFKLEPETPVNLTLTNWGEVTKTFGTETTTAIRFDITQIGEEKLDQPQIFDVSSKRLITQLKPFMQAREKSGVNQFTVRIIKMGSGYETKYGVKLLE